MLLLWKFYWNFLWSNPVTAKTGMNILDHHHGIQYTSMYNLAQESANY